MSKTDRLIVPRVPSAPDDSVLEKLGPLVGGPERAYIVGIGALCVVLQVFASYHRYIRVLKWLTLSLFAYVGVVFAVQVPWTDVLRGTIAPSLSFSADYVTTVVAVFGTTISPYVS